MTLLDYEMPLQALPLLCLYRHLAADTCRDLRHAVTADALAVQALCELGQLQHALCLLASAHAGTDLPLDRLELPPSRLREGSAPPQLASPPPFLVHLPTEDEANASAVDALLNMAVAGHLSAHYGDVLMRQLELCRVQLLLRFAERPPPLQVHGVPSGGGADPAAPKGGKGKAPPPAANVGSPLSGGDQMESLLAKAEELLEYLGAAITKELKPAVGAEPPRGATCEALAALACRGALLRAALDARRGLHTAAVSAASGGLALAQSVPVQDGAVGGAAPCVQVSALLWLRLRLSLVRSALAQRQLAAVEEQITLGRAEAQVANDARVKLTLRHAQLLLLVERGELGAAAEGFVAWLAHAMAVKMASSGRAWQDGCVPVSRHARTSSMLMDWLRSIPLSGSTSKTPS